MAVLSYDQLVAEVRETYKDFLNPAQPIPGTEWNPIKSEIRDLLEAFLDKVASVQSLATKGYKPREPARLYTTSNIDISTLNNGDTVDGETVATNDRVILGGQSTASQNGLYVIGASGPATRAADVDTGAELARSSFYVSDGTHAGQTWAVEQDDIELGTDAVSLVMVAEQPDLDAFLTAIAELVSRMDAAESDIDALETAVEPVPGLVLSQVANESRFDVLGYVTEELAGGHAPALNGIYQPSQAAFVGFAPAAKAGFEYQPGDVLTRVQVWFWVESGVDTVEVTPMWRDLALVNEDVDPGDALDNEFYDEPIVLSGLTEGAFYDVSITLPNWTAKANTLIMFPARALDSNGDPISDKFGCAAGPLPGASAGRKGWFDIGGGWSPVSPSGGQALGIQVYKRGYAARAQGAQVTRKKAWDTLPGKTDYEFDNTDGYTFMMAWPAPAHFDEVSALFVNGSTDVMVVERCKACVIESLADLDDAPDDATWVEGSYNGSTSITVPAMPGANRRGIGKATFALESVAPTDGDRPWVVVMAYVLSPQTLVMHGADATTLYDYSDWATHPEHPFIFRYQSGDCVTDPTDFTSTTNQDTSPFWGVEIQALGEVRTVAVNGDSTRVFNSDGPYVNDGWPSKAMYAEHTSMIGVGFVGLAQSGATAQEMHDQYVDMLDAGIIPDLADVQVATPNSTPVPITDQSITDQLNLALDAKRLLESRGVKVMLSDMLQTNPAEGSSEDYGSSDSKRYALNKTTLPALEDEGALLNPISSVTSGGFDGDGQEVLAASITDDGLHLNNDGHETVKPVAQEAYRAAIAGPGAAAATAAAVAAQIAANEATAAALAVTDKASGVASPNLVNISAAGVQLAKSPSTDKAGVYNNPFTNTTDYIPVVAGQTYYFSYKHNVQWLSTNDGTGFISASPQTDTSQFLVAPPGATYVRAGVALAKWTTGASDSIIIAKSASPVAWEPYVNYLQQAALKLSVILAVLGYTPANAANLVTSYSTTPVDSKWPSEKLVKDGIDQRDKYQFATNNNLIANADYADGTVGALTMPVSGSGSYSNEIPGLPEWYAFKSESIANFPASAELVNTMPNPGTKTNRMIKLRMVRVAGSGGANTDIQFRQKIPIPDWAVSEIATNGSVPVTLIFYYKTASNGVQISSTGVINYANQTDAVSSSTDTATKTSTDVVGSLGVARFTATIDDTSARYFVFGARFRTDSAVTTALDEYAYMGPMFVDFGRPEKMTGWERNDVERVDRQIDVKIAALDLGDVGALTASDVFLDARGNYTRIVPSKTLIGLGDSQMDSWDDELAAALPDWTVVDAGIGGETSTQALARANGHAVYTTGISWSAGTIRLKTRRAVPARLIDPAYSSSWNAYGVKIAEPIFVEFYNANGLIARSYDQEKAVSSVSGDTLTSVGHPWANGDQVYVLDASRPSNMYIGKVYYVSDVSGSTYKLKETSGGSVVTFNTFGGTITVLGGFYYDWAYNGSDDHTIRIETTTNWSAATWLIEPGTNDIQFTDTADVAIANAELFAAIPQTLIKRVIFAGIPGFYDSGDDAEWKIGGTRYNEMIRYNTYLSKRFGNHYVDQYTMLLGEGDGSANDLADIAAGLVPRSLRLSATDGHINTAGNILRAAQVAAAIDALGW